MKNALVLEIKPCPHCHAPYGHTHFCRKLNPRIAEAHATALTEGDAISLHGLGVSWTGGIYG